MVGLRRILQLTVLAGSIALSHAALECANSSFTYPELFGAQFLSLNAIKVDSLKVNATTPEGKTFIPKEGLSFCNVTIFYLHPGHNDTTKVQTWLPLAENWNERFVGVGGGGFAAGQFGNERIVATLAKGYATSSTDAGHDSVDWQRSKWILASKGNINYPLLFNFASLSVHDMTVIAKSLVQQYYGKAPRYSYWNGCSTGGRQGIMSAQRYPEDYDGVLAGAPAINQGDLIITTYWPQSVMDRLGVYPSKCEMDAIRSFAIQACDANDGVTDGVISDPDACSFDPLTVVGREVRCPNNTLKISTEAASIAQAIWDGPRSVDGRPLWLADGYPRSAPFTGSLALANTECDDRGDKCKGKPFTMSAEFIRNFIHKNPDYNVQSMSLSDLEGVYVSSRKQYDSILGSNDPDLSRFKTLGRKMISWHGLDDECVTMRGSRNYYDRVLAVDSNAREYYRHFEAPGINHCGGANGTFYPLRALESLRRWVEGGIAPEVLTGYNVTGGSDAESARRPLCAYPLIQKFKGGDPARYSSFTCVPRSEQDPPRARDEL